MYIINVNSVQNPVLFSYTSTVICYFSFLPENCQVKFTKETNTIELKCEDAEFCNYRLPECAMYMLSQKPPI